MSDRFFESVFNASSNPCMLVNAEAPDFTILTANPAYLSATGSTIEDIRGYPLFDAFPDNPAEEGADGVTNLRQSLEEVLRTGRPQYLYQQKYDVPKRSSPTEFELHFWDVVNSPVFDVAGNITAILHAVTDVTAKIVAQQQVAMQEHRFKSLVQEGGDLIGILDATGVYSYVSPTSLPVLGIDPEYFVGKNAFDFIHEEDRAAVFEQFSRLETEHRIQIDPFRFQHIDGSWRWIDTIVVNLLNDPSVNGIVANSRDITRRIEFKQSLQQLNSELVRINQELKTSNEDLEQFAFIASHDLQEPLRMVSGFMTQLQRKYGDMLDEKGKKYIHFAVDGANRMRTILMELLEYSRVGRINFHKENVNLNQVLADVRYLLTKQLDETDAELIVDELPVLHTCHIPIQQVFFNLISNAVKYGNEEDRPLVKVTAIQQEGVWCFSVADNGIGIHPDFHSKIFIMFQRLQVKPNTGGTGMGLAISKKIVEQLGGKIWVESELTRGATFYFTLPYL